MNIIVIGAGIGASPWRDGWRAGHKVTVIEKAAHPGGRADFIQKDGYRFDKGPTPFPDAGSIRRDLRRAWGAHAGPSPS